MDWSDANIARLRTLWAEGHSVAEIGRRMGVSKNAVVSNADRLGLDARPSPIRRSAPAKAAPIPRAGRTTLPPLPSLQQDDSNG